MKKVLVIDNYDSFVHNLAHSLAAAGATPTVIRNDKLDIGSIEGSYHGIVISPGPGHPGEDSDFGLCAQVLREVSPRVPTLGICLGMQGIAHVFGAKVARAFRPAHGKPTDIHHDGKGSLRGLPSPFVAGLYHSLCVRDEDLPAQLEIISRMPLGVIMGVRHRLYPIEGFQFHPESVLTPLGQRILDNFVSGLGA